MREFSRWFAGLLDGLDGGAGWCAALSRQDPEGMRRYREGVEVPPADVLHSLLQDLAVQRGTRLDPRVLEEAERMHAAALRAHDRLPGRAAELRGRLGAVLRERERAVLLEGELTRALRSAGAGTPAAEQLSLRLAWARIGRQRAVARCAELRTRLDELERAAPDTPDTPCAPDAPARPVVTAPPAPASEPDPAAKGRRPRRWRAGRTAGAAGTAGAGSSAGARPAPSWPRGARFAGLEEEGASASRALGPLPPPGPSGGGPGGAYGPGAQLPPVTGLRGARFAGACAPEAEPDVAEELPEEARARASEAADRLAALRRQGRSGAAYVLLCEVAAWPAAWLPAALAGLEDSGQSADAATLLWEVACRPPAYTAGAASALHRSGRREDCRTLLQQAVARPQRDLVEMALAADAAGRPGPRPLLEALVRARAPQEAAEVAAALHGAGLPGAAGLLAEAAERVSAAASRDVGAALRRVGLTQ
ncbi:hypothetical protein [Streptomyces thermolineatus]|uniref:hypothetical protein n=1 Tax=Streptomyces thermolineatus TaxID=44033 RepID=UPI00384BE4C8